MTPPKSIDKNIFEMSKRELTRSGVKKLPGNLYEAINKVEKDKFVANVLGEHIYDRYISAKRREWEEYSHRVSNWEIDAYLYKY